MKISDEKPIDRDGIIEFLAKHGIVASLISPDKYGYSRTIAFKVYEIEYRITWFCNMSTLEIGTGIRPSQIPFKYMYYDDTFPLVDGNRSIGFSYVKYVKENWTDRYFPFEVFRIPLEIK